jgi:DNA-damage-inducible protein J
MQLNDVVRARIDRETKERAEAVLAEIGLTVSDAVRLMMIRIAREGAMPFNPLIPNKETIEAIEEARAGKLLEVGTVDDLLNYLHEEDSGDEEVPPRVQARVHRSAKSRY